MFLTTDLEAGDQFYLSPKFLYGFREGIADPRAIGTTIADAVQASAALPACSPPVRLRTGPFRRPWDVPGGVPETPPERVVLSDGGVYDNMADQWESGLADRIRRWPELADVQEPADVLIVANSSAGWGWDPFDTTAWPKRELTALMRNQGVQYDVSTSRRRRALVQTWMDNERRGSGQGGVIVMIDRSPYRVADGFASDPGDRGALAKEAILFLGDSDESRRDVGTAGLGERVRADRARCPRSRRDARLAGACLHQHARRPLRRRGSRRASARSTADGSPVCCADSDDRHEIVVQCHECVRLLLVGVQSRQIEEMIEGGRTLGPRRPTVERRGVQLEELGP